VTTESKQCPQHPDELGEWDSDGVMLCQMCWESLCAGVFWQTIDALAEATP